MSFPFPLFCPIKALVETLVDRTTGTVIGNMTSGSSIANAFDGNTNQALGGGGGASPYAGGTSIYVGKTYSSAKILSKMIVYGSNDDGFIYLSNPSVTLKLYGKNGAAPASATDGTLIGTLTFTDTGNESAGRTVISTDLSNAYLHLWVFPDDGGATSKTVAEIEMYELV